MAGCRSKGRTRRATGTRDRRPLRLDASLLDGCRLVLRLMHCGNAWGMRVYDDAPGHRAIAALHDNINGLPVIRCCCTLAWKRQPPRTDALAPVDLPADEAPL